MPRSARFGDAEPPAAAMMRPAQVPAALEVVHTVGPLAGQRMAIMAAADPAVGYLGFEDSFAMIIPHMPLLQLAGHNSVI